MNGKPLSQVIRERIKSKGGSFFANENISEYLEEGDIDKLQAELEAKVAEVLSTLVIDTQHDHNTRETAKRVSKMLLREVYSGRYEPEPAVTAFPNHKNLDQVYCVGPITIHSTCSHHLCPIIGKAYVGILAGPNVVGLSKFNRLAQHIAKRPQIQEEMTAQIVTKVAEKSGAQGVIVVIESSHFCGVIRGVKDSDSKMVTSQVTGAFLEDPALKAEFFKLLELTR